MTSDFSTEEIEKVRQVLEIIDHRIKSSILNFNLFEDLDYT